MGVGRGLWEKGPLKRHHCTGVFPNPNPSSSSFPHFLFLPSSLSFHTPQTYLQIDLGAGAWGRGVDGCTHACSSEFRQCETCVEGSAESWRGWEGLS